MIYKKLCEIAKINAGGTPSRTKVEYWKNGNIPWLKISDIKGKFVTETEEFITQKGLDNSSAKIFKKGTLIYTIFATVGEVAFLDIDASTNQAIANVELTTNDLLYDYLYYYLLSIKYLVLGDSRGAAQNNINLGYLKELVVPIPSIEEQKKVITSLENIRQTIIKNEHEIGQLNELIRSRFIEMFGDLSFNTKKYPIKHLSDIAEYWNGLTYKPTDVVNDENGTLVLRSSNIQNGVLCFEDNVFVKCDIKPKYYVRENDILMCSRNGSAKLVGKVALINGLKKPTVFGAFMMIIRSKYYPFLKVYFETNWFREQLSTGTSTVNQITGGMLDDIVLPVPDLNQVLDFQTFSKFLEKTRFSIQKRLVILMELFDKKMEEFFGGND